MKWAGAAMACAALAWQAWQALPPLMVAHGTAVQPLHAAPWASITGSDLSVLQGLQKLALYKVQKVRVDLFESLELNLKLRVYTRAR